MTTGEQRVIRSEQSVTQRRGWAPAYRGGVEEYVEQGIPHWMSLCRLTVGQQQLQLQQRQSV